MLRREPIVPRARLAREIVRRHDLIRSHPGPTGVCRCLAVVRQQMIDLAQCSKIGCFASQYVRLQMQSLPMILFIRGATRSHMSVTLTALVSTLSR